MIRLFESESCGGTGFVYIFPCINLMFCNVWYPEIKARCYHNSHVHLIFEHPPDFATIWQKATQILSVSLPHRPKKIKNEPKFAKQAYINMLMELLHKKKKNNGKIGRSEEKEKKMNDCLLIVYLSGGRENEARKLTKP